MGTPIEPVPLRSSEVAPRSDYDTMPWLRFYAKDVPTQLQVPDVPLTRFLDDAAARFPNRDAVVFFGRSLTYRKLLTDVERFAMALWRLGVRKGDRVALILPNCPQEVIAFYAILRLGAVVVPHNPLYTAPELHHQLSDSGAQVVIVFDKAYETLRAATEGTNVRHVVVTSLADYLPPLKQLALKLPLRKARRLREELTAEITDDVIYFDDLLEKSPDRHPQAQLDPARDLAVLQYTGGTTGRPKGAMLTHRNLVANAHQTIAMDQAIRPGQEVNVAVVPLFHVFGLTSCLTSMVLIGGTVVLIPRFDVDLVLDAIHKHKPTIFPGVPPIYQQLAMDPRARKAGVGKIRTCISGAMNLPRSTVEAFRANTGGRVVQGYGMTETSPVAIANPIDGNARHVSVGLPVPGTEAMIVDENDPARILPTGYPGELLVRGPQVFAGYWNQPAETAAALSGGWVRTGDIAAMSPDGYFTLIDRKRDVLIVDGMNVYPSEVEAVLSLHRSVEECAVVGVPESAHGEAVVAYIVPRLPYVPSAGEIFSHCAEQLAAYKVPTRIEIRESLPRNMLGKVLRRVLREELATAAP
jgi:long-chain acyl-CoA synthetase